MSADGSAQAYSEGVRPGSRRLDKSDSDSEQDIDVGGAVEVDVNATSQPALVAPVGRYLRRLCL